MKSKNLSAKAPRTKKVAKQMPPPKQDKEIFVDHLDVAPKKKKAVRKTPATKKKKKENSHANHQTKVSKKNRAVRKKPAPEKKEIKGKIWVL